MDRDLYALLVNRKLTPEDVVAIYFLERDLRKPWWLRLLQRIWWAL